MLFRKTYQESIISDYEKALHNEEDAEMSSNCDYVLELVDSSYWLVTTNDERALSNMRQKLTGVAVYRL
jgi:hypothetical protein